MQMSTNWGKAKSSRAFWAHRIEFASVQTDRQKRKNTLTPGRGANSVGKTLDLQAYIHMCVFVCIYNLYKIFVDI